LDSSCALLLRAIVSDDAAETAAEFMRELDVYNNLEAREASATTLLWLCADAHDREGAGLVANAIVAEGDMNAHLILSAFIATVCKQRKPDAAPEVLEAMEQHAGVQAAQLDLEKLFNTAVSVGHLPAATHALAALEAGGVVADADLRRWRAAIRSVEEEERLREELAQPNAHTQLRKYALFKSSLSNSPLDSSS
jgi:hypothetical protein